MMKLGPDVLQELFGESMDGAKIRAATLLATASISDAEGDFPDLLNCVLAARNSADRADIVAVGIVFRPHLAHIWLKEVMSLYDSDADNSRAHRSAFARTAAVLGLFRGAKKLVHSICAGVRSETQFEKDFPSAIARIILCELLFAPSDGHIEEGELANTIKAYVRKEPTKGYGDFDRQLAMHHRRAASIFNELSLEGGLDLQDSSKDDIRLIILEQLSYAFFGLFSPVERAEAIRLSLQREEA